MREAGADHCRGSKGQKIGRILVLLQPWEKKNVPIAGNGPIGTRI